MKIYINKFNLTLLPEIERILLSLKIMKKQEQYINLKTNEGIYQINGTTIIQLNPKDGPIEILEKYYNDFALIKDCSYYEKRKVSVVHGLEHYSQEIIKTFYKTNCCLDFVIEKDANNENKCMDCYFETEKTVDLKDLLVKQAIIEFLLQLT